MKKGLWGVLLLLVAFGLSSCNNVGPVVKYLKEINNEPARNWIAFLQKNGIDAIDSNGSTILVQAVMSRDPVFVEACLKCKANVNITSQNQRFPLTIAVGNDDPEIEEMLLKAGAQITPRPAENNVNLALTRGFDKSLEVLLKYKPELDFRTTDTVLFRQGTLPPKAVIVAQLDAAGFKPSRADLYTLTDAYRYAETSADEAVILAFIEKCVKDPVYRDYLPNEEGNVFTLQYKITLLDRDGYNSYKKAISLFKVFLEAGIPAKLNVPKSIASTDLADLVRATKSESFASELKTLFESHRIAFTED